MSIHIFARIRVKALGLLAVLTFAAPLFGAPEFYFYLQGKKTEIDYDANHLAIRTKGKEHSPDQLDAATTDKLASGLAAGGLGGGKVEQFKPHGWGRVSLPDKASRGAAVSGHDRMRQLSEIALANSDVVFASPVLRAKNGDDVIVTGDLLVAFNTGVSEADQKRILASIPHHGATTAKKIGHRTHWTVSTTMRNGVDVLDAANALAERPEVNYAEPNFVLTSHTTSLGGYYSSNWAISSGSVNLDVRNAWFQQGITGSGVTVVILDVGVQMSGNPYLRNVVAGADFTYESVSNPGGPNGSYDTHGTMVASCVAGVRTVNGMDIGLGSAPYASIASARVQFGTDTTGKGSIYNDAWTRALDWAINTVHARVSNTSLGVTFQTNAMTTAFSESTTSAVSPITSAFDTASAKGMVHFAAAGNNGNSSPISYPAAISSVNAVGALDSSGNLASFSCTGPEMDFAGPGVQVQVAVRSDDPAVYPNYNADSVYRADGTSFASPYCAGIAALVIQKYGSSWPAGAVTTGMVASAQRFGNGVPNASFGYGLPQGNEALTNNLWQAFNVSTLAPTSTGSNVLIMGFTIAGTGTKQLLMRGVGPTLTSFGVSNALSDPVLTLYNSASQPIASNQGWGNSSTLADAAAAVWAFPLQSNNDSALIANLSSGTYTAIIASASGATGNAIAEAYDMNPSAQGIEISNLSSRIYMPAGTNGTAGFIVQGNTTKQVMIRAVGPTLSDYGIENPLPNPTLTIYKINPGGNQVVASNTNWNTASNSSSIASFASQVGAFPLSTSAVDSAVLTYLAPGTYTAVSQDQNGQAGVLLIEVYKAPN
jgi:hypothetical protein